MGLGYIDAGLNEVDSWDGSYTPIDNGDYAVVVTDVTEGTSKSSDNPMLTVKFEVLSNEDGSDTPMEGRSVTAWYVLRGDGRKRTRAFIEALGLLQEDGSFDGDKIQGSRLAITVTTQTRQFSDPTTGERKETTSNKVSRERPLEEVEAAAEGDLPPDDEADVQTAAAEAEEAAQKAAAEEAAKASAKSNGNGKATKPAAKPVAKTAKTTQKSAR